MFFFLGRRPNVALGAELGCELREDSTLKVDDNQQTTVDGVYAAGNCADGRAQVVWAAADGSKAAIAINVSLLAEDVEAHRG